MNWKGTLLKNKNIKWKPAKVEYIKDEGLDFVIVFPLTSLFEAQAKASFSAGVLTALTWVAQKQGKPIKKIDLIEFLADIELSELANQLHASEVKE